MAEIIEMPKLSDTQTVGTLISWLKKTGEKVEEGEIIAEVETLAVKAKNKELSQNELTGSTITTTNLGMFGVSSFHAIINPPNSAILSVGAIVKKPIVDDDDNIIVGQCMTVGFSGDHRSVDGALGAEYLSALRAILETPALMLI